MLKAKIRLYPHRQFLVAQTNRYGQKFGVRLYDIAVGHDHIHLALLIPNRSAYNAFIRALTSLNPSRWQTATAQLPYFEPVDAEAHELFVWGRIEHLSMFLRTCEKVRRKFSRKCAGREKAPTQWPLRRKSLLKPWKN